MKPINLLSRQERLYAVYAAYGESMIASHSLEGHLKSLLVTHAHDQKLSKLDFDSEKVKLDRLTLGQLIAKFCAAFNPTESLQEELENMLFFRNELAHRFAEIVLSAATERNWEVKLVTQLHEWTQMFKETQQLLEPYKAAWLAKHEIDLSSLVERSIEFYPGIRKLLKREV